jgi:single-stranded-DNA-specific exonuclease
MAQPTDAPSQYKELSEPLSARSVPSPELLAQEPRAPLAADVLPAGPLRDPGPAGTDAVALSRELGSTLTVADALARAGWTGGEATRRWLDPLLSHLSPPDAMADRGVASERIARAVRAKEKIAVFGDYDCDGITACAIVTGILRALGGHVVPLLATRLDGGYGLSGPALRRVLATGATLLVTCDCGSSDHPRLDDARKAGVDAVVIDHHLVPQEPLPAVAFLNPHRPDCGFSYKHLASCGLALSLGAALRKQLGATLDLRPWLDLVAIGTVADVAPLDGDNRCLVRAGLGVLASGRRVGLRALGALAKIDPSGGLRGDDIAFRFAPRLNAPGRLGDPDLSLELLLEPDPTRARAIAASIEQLTIERRAVQDRMIAEALSEIDERGFARDPAMVLARQGWHPGVVGIVAGRIASRFGVPTIVVALEGDRGRGSVRGPAGFRLHDALSRCRDDLVGFGGHQAAAGLEVRADRVDALRDAWCAASAASGHALGPEAVDADVRLDDRDDAAAVVRDLARLEPCGEANRAPRLLVRGRVLASKEVKGHLKLELGIGGGARVSAFGFELGSLAPAVAGRSVEAVGWLRRDSWLGGDAVEMKIERIASRA